MCILYHIQKITSEQELSHNCNFTAQEGPTIILIHPKAIFFLVLYNTNSLIIVGDQKVEYNGIITTVL